MDEKTKTLIKELRELGVKSAAIGSTGEVVHVEFFGPGEDASERATEPPPPPHKSAHVRAIAQLQGRKVSDAGES